MLKFKRKTKVNKKIKLYSVAVDCGWVRGGPVTSTTRKYIYDIHI